MTSETVQELESEYLRRPKPDRQEIEEIAERLGQKEINVYAWFYRRRMKEIKDGGKPPEDDARCKEVIKKGFRRRNPKASGIFAKEELAVLENIFTRQNNPGHGEIVGLARWFSKEEKKISTWFARRRLKFKKDFVNNLEDDYCATPMDSSSEAQAIDGSDGSASPTSPDSPGTHTESPNVIGQTSPTRRVQESSTRPASPNSFPLNLTIQTSPKEISQEPCASPVRNPPTTPKQSEDDVNPVAESIPYPLPLTPNKSTPSPELRIISAPLDEAVTFPVHPNVIRPSVIRPNVIRRASSSPEQPPKVKQEPLEVQNPLDSTAISHPSHFTLPHDRSLDVRHRLSPPVPKTEVKKENIEKLPDLVPIDLWNNHVILPPVWSHHQMIPPWYPNIWNVYGRHPPYLCPPVVPHPLYGFVPNAHFYYGPHTHVSRTWAPAENFGNRVNDGHSDERIREKRYKLLREV